MQAHPLLFATPELAPLVARLKLAPEDFEVEEIPAYLPLGEGTHLFLWVEKRDAAAAWFLGQMARFLEVRREDLGVAGNKDRTAVTRQWISVSTQDLRSERLRQMLAEGPQAFVGPVNPQIRVLEATRHGNKLRTGHTHGNRFRVTLRELERTPEEALAQARAVAAALEQTGVPNYYGTQRFGRGGQTLALGWGLLQGDREAAREVGRDGFLRRLSISALQSELFNRVLTRRMSLGLMDRVLAGDVVQKTPRGASFVVEPHEVEEVQERLLRREVVVTGPMPGPRMTFTRHEALELETAVYQEAGVRPEDFAKFGALAEGTRRPLQVWPEGLAVEALSDARGPALAASFALPAGAYATVVLREFLKNDDQESPVEEGA